jgi:hypothetical protein
MQIKVKALDTTTAKEDMKVDIQADCVTLLNAKPAAAQNIQKLNIVESGPNEVGKVICKGV